MRVKSKGCVAQCYFTVKELKWYYNAKNYSLLWEKKAVYNIRGKNILNKKVENLILF